MESIDRTTETDTSDVEKTVEKIDLKKLTREQLKTFCEEQGLQSYRADQLFQWLYQKGVSEFSEMTNLSKDLRAKLDAIARVSRIKLHRRSEEHTSELQSRGHLVCP